MHVVKKLLNSCSSILPYNPRTGTLKFDAVDDYTINDKSRAIAGTTARCAQYMSAQIIM